MTECVSTLAQLEKTPVVTKCVIVEGYHKAGDGGGGTFYWDDSFDGTSDGGTTFMSKIVPVPPKGCWRRIFDGPISVKWFGARGDFDPTTGNGGDLDNTAIQSAMDLVKLIGLPLYFPPGKYKVTSTLQYHSSNLDADGEKNTTVGYWNSQQGLHVFGAGMQKSIIYNQIRNANRTGAAAISILRDTSDTRTFQQSGVIRDLQITSDKMIDGSVGIEMATTWAYTIQRVRIMKMGSHGIRIQNWLGDFDGTENLHLDNIVSEYNGGWGIVVDAKEGCESVGFIHIERCKITENKGGGIQWTGQIGVIERCGIYGNGVFPKGTKDPNKPVPIADAYGILVKNVKGTPNGLLITGCELQGNADIQVLVAVGANIRIIQNEFKDDDISEKFSFPSIDIQVGDGNVERVVAGRKITRPVNACVIEDNRIRTAWRSTPASWGKEDKPPSHTVVKVNTNAIGTVIGKFWTGGYKRFEGDKIVELVEVKPLVFLDGYMHLKTHIHTDGVEGGHVLLPFASKRFNINNQPTPADPNMSEFKRLTEARIISVANDKPEVTFVPDTSQWGNFEIIVGGTFESIVLANPTAHTVGAPLFFEFVNNRSGYPILLTFGSEYVAGSGIELFPGEIITGMMVFDETHHWRLYTPWTYQGVPLPLKEGQKPPQSKIL